MRLEIEVRTPSNSPETTFLIRKRIHCRLCSRASSHSIQVGGNKQVLQIGIYCMGFLLVISSIRGAVHIFCFLANLFSKAADLPAVSTEGTRSNILFGGGVFGAQTLTFSIILNHFQSFLYISNFSSIFPPVRTSLSACSWAPLRPCPLLCARWPRTSPLGAKPWNEIHRIVGICWNEIHSKSTRHWYDKIGCDLKYGSGKDNIGNVLQQE